MRLTAARRRQRRPRRGTFERGAQHVDGLGAQLVQRPVAVDALAQVDLGHAVRAQGPAPRRRAARARRRSRGRSRPSRRPSGGGGLAGQWLADVRELGEEQLEHGACHELGDAAAPGRLAVERTRVEALDQHRALADEQRPEQPAHEGAAWCWRRRRRGTRSRRPPPHRARPPWRRPCRRCRLAPPRRWPPLPGLCGRVVDRPVVDHDAPRRPARLPPCRRQEGLDHGPHDRSDGRALVPGRDADRDRAPGALLGRGHHGDREVPVGEGVGHAPIQPGTPRRRRRRAGRRRRLADDAKAWPTTPARGATMEHIIQSD